MRFLRRVHAEWLLLAPRVTRTRLGLALLSLGLVLMWLRTRGLDPLAVVLQAGALGAVMGVRYAAAPGDSDRAFFVTALTHPTTPLAIATGRWLGAIIPALGLVIVMTAVVGWETVRAGAGIAAAAAVGSCALAAVLAFGNAATIPVFLIMAAAGAIPPERLADLARPGVVRLAAASAFELGPALWHYRDIAAGSLLAITHSLAWTGLGVLLASGLISRFRTTAE